MYRYFFRGLIAFLPVALTVYLLFLFVSGAESIAVWLVRPLIGDFYLPGLGLLFGVGLILMLGFLVSHPLASRLFSWVEMPFTRLPVVKSIYSSLKNFADYFSPHDNKPQQQVVLLRQRLQTAAASGDTRLLAGTEQAARWQRLERAEQLAASLPVTAEQRRQLALYRGLLIWEDNENYPGRAWELNRQLEDAEALVEQTRAGTARLDDAMARRQQSGYAPRIAALETRVQAGAAQVQQAIAAAQQRLRQVAVAELQRQAAQLSHSLGQSRLAIARLYDQGSPEVPR